MVGTCEHYQLGNGFGRMVPGLRPRLSSAQLARIELLENAPNFEIMTASIAIRTAIISIIPPLWNIKRRELTNADHEFSKPVPTTSAVLGDGQLVELVYDRDKRRTSLAVWNGETWRLEDAVTLDNGRRLIPYSAENNLIQNEVILLPSKPGGIRYRGRARSGDPGFHPPLRRYQPPVRADRQSLRSVFVDLRWLQRAALLAPAG